MDFTCFLRVVVPVRSHLDPGTARSLPFFYFLPTVVMMMNNYDEEDEAATAAAMEDLIDPATMVVPPPEAMVKEFFRQHIPEVDHVMITLLFQYYLSNQPEIQMKPIANSTEMAEMCKRVICKNPQHNSVSTKMRVLSKRHIRLKYVPCTFLSPDTDETNCNCYTHWCISCFSDMAVKEGLFSDGGVQCFQCNSPIRLSMFRTDYYYSMPRKRQGRAKEVKTVKTAPIPPAAAATAPSTPTNNNGRKSIKLTRNGKVTDEYI